jgi:hypothetical protein
MSNIKMAAFQSNLFEELDDADLVAVTGGGTVGNATGTVTDTNSALGNGAQPTSGAVILAGTTLVNAGNYLLKVGNGTESGLVAANGGVANTVGSLG